MKPDSIRTAWFRVTAFICKLWIYYNLMLLIEEMGQRRRQKSDFKFYLRGIRLWVTEL